MKGLFCLAKLEHRFLYEDVFLLLNIKDFLINCLEVLMDWIEETIIFLDVFGLKSTKFTDFSTC